MRPHGLDVTKTILGHSKVETTQIYAEKDLAAAMVYVVGGGLVIALVVCWLLGRHQARRTARGIAYDK